jgi:16S rRNA (uracil1498-N3)-methyltransferase
VLAETEKEIGLSDVLRSADDVNSLALAIGPEGGWTEEELRAFEEARWMAASLGETILRAETAAMAAMAIARS